VHYFSAYPRTYEEYVSSRLPSLQVPSLLTDKGNPYGRHFLTWLPIGFVKHAKTGACGDGNRSIFRNVVFSGTSDDKQSIETQQSQKSVDLDHIYIHDTHKCFLRRAVFEKIDIFRFESEAYEQELNSTDYSGEEFRVTNLIQICSADSEIKSVTGATPISYSDFNLVHFLQNKSTFCYSVTSSRVYEARNISIAFNHILPLFQQ
jgi:hypothetical protein